ncbi:hypothetical protein SNR37_003590 [Agarivorans aestuarii]|uniref:Uncharacterized protein n=1 Tax=Agarivorans aestuarii TaxID=1563703 RepID=A0ABU7G6U2_9ALTE|nr:hypothetical protein [Agarivorans aestuarii]MEE1674155.1 hypothetical protein [Agarivorans aestuarii]
MFDQDDLKGYYNLLTPDGQSDFLSSRNTLLLELKDNLLSLEATNGKGLEDFNSNYPMVNLSKEDLEGYFFATSDAYVSSELARDLSTKVGLEGGRFLDVFASAYEEAFVMSTKEALKGKGSLPKLGANALVGAGEAVYNNYFVESDYEIIPWLSHDSHGFDVKYLWLPTGDKNKL